MPILSSRPDTKELLELLPYRRYIRMMRDRVARLTKKLGASAYMDQYAGKTIPQAFSALYGPISLQTPRRVGTTGFYGEAALIDPAQFIIPRDGTWKTGREGAFHWCGSSATAYLTWTRTDANGDGGPTVALPAGDIYTPVFENNGGAMAFHNLIDIKFSPDLNGAGATELIAPSIHFDIDLYDKKRGRSITDGRVPAETFFAGTLGFKPEDELRWDVDTEVEPRLYVNQARVPNMDTSATIFADARVSFYVMLTMHGYTTLAEDRDAIA